MKKRRRLEGTELSSAPATPTVAKEVAPKTGPNVRIPRIPSRKAFVDNVFTMQNWLQGETIPTKADGCALFGHEGRVIANLSVPLDRLLCPLVELDSTGIATLTRDAYGYDRPLLGSTLAETARRLRAQPVNLTGQCLQTSVSIVDLFSRQVRILRPDLFERRVLAGTEHLPLGFMVDVHCGGPFMLEYGRLLFPKQYTFNGWFQKDGELRVRIFEWLDDVPGEQQPYIAFLRRIGIPPESIEVLHFNPPFNNLDVHIRSIIQFINFIKSKNPRVVFGIIITVVALKESTGLTEFARSNDCEIRQIDGARYISPTRVESMIVNGFRGRDMHTEIPTTTIIVYPRTVQPASTATASQPQYYRSPPQASSRVPPVTRFIPISPGLIASFTKYITDSRTGMHLQQTKQENKQLKEENERLEAEKEALNCRVLQLQRELQVSQKAEEAARDALAQQSKEEPPSVGPLRSMAAGPRDWERRRQYNERLHRPWPRRSHSSRPYSPPSRDRLRDRSQTSRGAYVPPPFRSTSASRY